MTVVFFGLVLKSVSLTLWALLYNLTFKKPYLLNSDLLKYLGLSLLILASSSVLVDLDFFFLLLMIIYISALVILFLLAYLISPLDSILSVSGNPLNPQKSSLTQAETLSLAVYFGFVNASLTFVERITVAKLYFLTDSLQDINWFKRDFGEHTNWLITQAITDQISKQLKYEQAASPITLGLELCTTYSVGLFCIIITLFIVLVGLLDWARHSYRQEL